MQYITGEVAFRHINVKVRPGVLIPRPETEVLVSEVLGGSADARAPRDVAWNPEAAEQEREAVAAVKKALEEAGESASLSVGGDLGRPSAANDDDADAAAEPSDAAEDSSVGGDLGRPSSAGMDETRKSLLVADLCTGSGCIACSLAYEHPDVRVIATDVAPEAVALAKENAEALGLADRVAVLAWARLAPASAEKRMAPSTPWSPTRPTCPPPLWLAFRARWPISSRRSPWTGRRRARSVPAARPVGRPGPEAWRRARLRAVRGAHGRRRAVAEQAGFVDVHIVDDLTGRPRVLVAKR